MFAIQLVRFFSLPIAYLLPACLAACTRPYIVAAPAEPLKCEVLEWTYSDRFCLVGIRPRKLAQLGSGLICFLLTALGCTDNPERFGGYTDLYRSTADVLAIGKHVGCALGLNP